MAFPLTFPPSPVFQSYPQRFPHPPTAPQRPWAGRLGRFARARKSVLRNLKSNLRKACRADADLTFPSATPNGVFGSSRPIFVSPETEFPGTPSAVFREGRNGCPQSTVFRLPNALKCPIFPFLNIQQTLTRIWRTAKNVLSLWKEKRGYANDAYPRFSVTDYQPLTRAKSVHPGATKPVLVATEPDLVATKCLSVSRESLSAATEGK